MTLTTSARMAVVKKEEKEAKVRQFLIEVLNARGSSSAHAPPVLRVLAQSMDSPVVRAVDALKVELIAASVGVEIVFAKVDATKPLPLDQVALAYRQLTDPRFHDAHELLVLEPNTAWVGDCMRRDPVVRDSFELHSADHIETAKWAAKSFSQVWLRAKPLTVTLVQSHALVVDAAAPDHADLAELVAVTAEVANPVVVLTRH
jgi:hypothetical protein